MTPLTALVTGFTAQAETPTLPIPTGNSARPGSPQLDKLRKAAGEFESMLLESLWKSMKESFSDPDDPDSDPTLQSFDEWGIQAMASAVGNAGGLGIKSLILKHLEPTASTVAGAPNRA